MHLSFHSDAAAGVSEGETEGSDFSTAFKCAAVCGGRYGPATVTLTLTCYHYSSLKGTLVYTVCTVCKVP